MRLLGVISLFSSFFLFAEGGLSNTLLEGRVQEIFSKPEVRIPIELRATQLKLPITPTPTRLPLQLGLKSLPAVLRGEWHGNLRIEQFKCSESFVRTQPEDAEKQA